MTATEACQVSGLPSQEFPCYKTPLLSQDHGIGVRIRTQTTQRLLGMRRITVHGSWVETVLRQWVQGRSCFYQDAVT